MTRPEVSEEVVDKVDRVVKREFGVSSPEKVPFEAKVELLVSVFDVDEEEEDRGMSMDAEKKEKLKKQLGK